MHANNNHFQGDQREEEPDVKMGANDIEDSSETESLITLLNNNNYQNLRNGAQQH